MIRRFIPCLCVAALLAAFVVGCGGAPDGSTVPVDPEVLQKNKNRGEQIRKEMEAKYKKGPGGRR